MITVCNIQAWAWPGRIFKQIITSIIKLIYANKVDANAAFPLVQLFNIQDYPLSFTKA